MSQILQIFYILISALSLAIAIPNELYHFGSPAFALISLIPLYLVATNLKSYKNALWFLALHSFLVHLFSSYWLGLFREMGILTLSASAIGTAIEGALCGLFFYIPFPRYKKYQLRLYSSASFLPVSCFRILWFTICYVSWEWLKSSGFLGYPWGTISSAMYKWFTLIQIADITGRYGISFIIILFNAILAEGIQLYFASKKYENIQTRVYSYSFTAIFCSVLLVSSTIYGFYRIYQKRPVMKELNIVMVQQNSDPWESKRDNENILNSIELTEKALKEANDARKKIDLVVWSEGVLKYSFPTSKSHYKYFPKENPLIPYIASKNIPFLIGGPVNIDGDFRDFTFNSSLLFDNQGNYRGYYPKNHLVPFAEVIPFAENRKVARFFRKIGLGTGWSSGNQYVVYEIPCQKYKTKRFNRIQTYSLAETLSEQKSRENQAPFVNVATPICFDDSFPDICNRLADAGAEVFINLTDNSWSKTNCAEYQHFANSVYRCIELRLSMARSTNSGYSVILDPTGKILKDMPLFEQDSIFATIPVYQTVRTIYQRFGNWLAYLCIIFIFLVFILQIKLLNSPLDPKSENIIGRKPRKPRNSKKSRKKRN